MIFPCAAGQQGYVEKRRVIPYFLKDSVSDPFHFRLPDPLNETDPA